MIGVIEFGSTCRRRIRRGGVPVALALSTNGRPVTDAAWPRTIRVYQGHQGTELAMTVFLMEAPARAPEGGRGGGAEQERGERKEGGGDAHDHLVDRTAEVPGRDPERDPDQHRDRED